MKDNMKEKNIVKKKEKKLKWDNIKPVDKKGWLWTVGILNAVSELRSLGRKNASDSQK